VTAQHLLTALFNAGIAISVGATVLSLGMTFTVRELVAPLHRVVLVAAMVVLNAGVIPAVAWGIAEILPMSSKYVPGLVLATLGAGSAASLKAAQLAKRADLPLAVSVVVVLQLVNIIAVPLWAGQVVTGASISAWQIVKSLGLLPGMLLGGRSAETRTTAGMVSVFRFASLGLIIIGAQLHGNPVYLGPAITFALVDFILPLALAVEIGHRAGTSEPAP